jgi:hypothetical protein
MIAEGWDELEAPHFTCFAERSGATVKRLLGLAEPSHPSTGEAGELTALRAEVAKLKGRARPKAAEAVVAQKEVADLKRQNGSLRDELERSRRESADLKDRGSSIAAEIGNLKAALAKRDTEIRRLQMMRRNGAGTRSGWLRRKRGPTLSPLSLRMSWGSFGGRPRAVREGGRCRRGPLRSRATQLAPAGSHQRASKSRRRRSSDRSSGGGGRPPRARGGCTPGLMLSIVIGISTRPRRTGADADAHIHRLRER